MEVFDVLHVDGGAADMLDAGACGVKNMLNVLQCLGCLLASGFAGQFAGGRVDAQLAETNTKPLAFTAWLYAPSAAGASEVATASIFSLIMFSFEERVIASCLRSGRGKPRQRNLKQSLYPWNRRALSHVPNTGSVPRPFTYLCGGLDGDRTHDLLFRRQTLYPLSYKPVRQPTLHCLEMKATLFTEKWSLNLNHYVGKISMDGVSATHSTM